MIGGIEKAVMDKIEEKARVYIFEIGGVEYNVGNVIASMKSEIATLRADRLFVVGCNEGFEAGFAQAMELVTAQIRALRTGNGDQDGAREDG